MILPVILCGGSGTRLWPLSRKAYPKQLLTMSSGYSMLQETMQRLTFLSNLLPPIVICNEAHRFIVAEQLLELGITHPTIILEPVAKSTAPAVAIAALAAKQNATLLILPADHQIKNVGIFHDGVAKANVMAQANYLVTFGVEPIRPDTAYGYIKTAEAITHFPGYQVAEFVEKPNLETATTYVASKDYFWNSGMFMFQAEAYLNELNKFYPDIVKHSRVSLAKAKYDMDFIRLDVDAFKQCENISIDYAVMEKSQRVAMVSLIDSGWSDLGSWDAMYEAKVKDKNNNVIHGGVYTENVTNSYLHAEDRLLAVVGVTDHIIVETADAVLVAHKDASQSVKQIVTNLQNQNRIEVDTHRRVHRPWGHYEVLDNAREFQVKRIFVKPGASLSLQMHQFRSEHWIVIKGTALVICGKEEFTLDANQSTYIPVNTKHRLKNPGETELVIIEVQTGSYLGEDDIVRYDDHYGREVEEEAIVV